MIKKWILSMVALSLVVSMALMACAAPAPAPAPTPTPAPAPAPAPKPAPKPIELVWASEGKHTHQRYYGTAQPWMEAVKSRTEGLVKFQEAPGGTLLKAKEMPEGIGTKVADIGFFGAQLFPALFPAYNLTGILDPVGGAKLKPYQNVMITRILLHEFPFIQEQFEKANLMTLLITSSEPQPLFATKPVKTLDDFKGLRIRAIGKYVTKSLALIGAEGITMAYGDLYSGLSKGIVDGCVTIPSSWRDNKLYEVTHGMTFFSGGRGMMIATTSYGQYMNLEVFNGLPSDIKRIMLEEAKTVEKEYALRTEALSWEAVDDMVGHGVAKYQISEEECAAWSEMIAPQFDEAAAELDADGLPGTPFVNRYKELRTLSILELEELYNKAWDAMLATIK